jgi:putative hydrolase of the HAD superfamily
MCLSNTNAIHIKALNSILHNTSKYSDLNQLMHKTYYSHELLCRKPDPKIWNIVLDQNNLSPNEVLYFEDNESNHEQALSLGLNSVLISNDYTIENYFNE